MLTKIKTILCMLVLVFISGCATSLKLQDLQAVKTVGIIDKFPDNPNFVTIGTTIFNNEYAEIKDSQFKQVLIDTTLSYISSKGYKVSVINEEQRNAYDLVLELIPRDVYATPGTYGFGVNQRSFLGNPMQANTYVALNVGSYINGKSKCSACYLQKLKPIEIEQLPLTWEELSNEQREHITEVLSVNIKESLSEILVQVGI